MKNDIFSNICYFIVKSGYIKNINT